MPGPATLASLVVRSPHFNSAYYDAADVAVLTTTGRSSGRPRAVEIWFALAGTTAYILAGDGRRAHWVRNGEAEPRVTLLIRRRTFSGRARVVGAAETRRASQVVRAKYEKRYDVSDWGDDPVAVAIDLDV